jgi:hypothetical protein
VSERADIEMAFIRMLSVNGLILSGDLSMENRRERIRAAIVGRNLQDCPYDSEISFGEAYSRCYAQNVASRGAQRDQDPEPADEAGFTDESELES